MDPNTAANMHALYPGDVAVLAEHHSADPHAGANDSILHDATPPPHSTEWESLYGPHGFYAYATGQPQTLPTQPEIYSPAGGPNPATKTGWISRFTGKLNLRAPV